MPERRSRSIRSRPSAERVPQREEDSAEGLLAPGAPGWSVFVWTLFLAGFATFALLFAPQAFLPALSQQLAVDADAASMTVSATTLGVAAGVLGWAGLSNRLGRLRTIRISLLLALLFALAIPFLPDLPSVVAVRFVEGLALGAAPAVGMASIAERVDGRWAAHVAGTFVAGNTLGGIVGRLASGAVADVGGWRAAFWTSAGTAAVAVVALLVLSRRLADHRPAEPPHGTGHALLANLRDPSMLALYLQGFLLMGAFGAVYNVFGYRVQEPDIGLPAWAASLLFIVYLAGSFAAQRSGALARRAGTARAMVAGSAGMLVSLPMMASDSLVLMVAGLVLFTLGCFTTHPLAGGLSGRSARVGRPQSTALYQIAWLGGTSLFGWLGGLAYAATGWGTTLALVAVLCTAAALAAVLRGTVLTRIRPVLPTGG
ncbi:MFS transporter [Rathayibacter sp. VKM Ac-2929]|uniref:MFS transporter n=1 Tax=Rathayibacter sp. VKM Ac-2929 TaxID=2929480 RepID=UPI001FB50BCF|nr:MFS transporter [Rathayibacter sp. VKM Ac-2929]MCJ1675495.1 MFS transporter [Rathayibacter sp. VKM Ac-2929]